MTKDVQSFQVSTRVSGELRTVRVKVYDDVNRLRRDADRYTARREGEYTGYAAHALAVTHPRVTYPGPAAGMIRLWRERLGTSVVVHEVAHMAQNIYRADWQLDHGTPDEDIDNEEVLCYLIGDLTALIVHRLYRLGYYDQ